jgi:ACS family glucarate transporter-like MFS transporter
MGTPRASRIRHLVVFLTMLVAVMLYLDRICLSIAERFIQKDLGLSDVDMRWLLSAFFWTYAFGQVPAGWLSDRYGVRLTLAVYLALWSAFTGWMGLAAGLAMLLLLRLGSGLAEAGAYPAAASLLSVWVPPDRRGTASGIVSVGGRLGGAAAQVLTGYLMVAFTASAPSLLGPDDLLDIAGMGRPPTKRSDELAEPARRQILALLSPEAQAVIKEAAQAGPGFRPNDTQVRQLADSLNHLIEMPDLYAHVDLPALDLLSPRASVKGKDRERYNRLLLEAAFPEGLREVVGPGWRPVMLVYGAAGLAIAIVFWWLVRDRPRQHSGCNDAEVALIEAGRPSPVSHKPVGGPPWRDMLRSVSLWLISIVSFFTNVGWVFLITSFPRFLKEEHHVGVVARSWMAFLPLAVGIVGMYLGGWLTDRLKSAYGAWWGRSFFLGFSRFLVMAGFLGCVWLRTPWGVTLALVLVAWATDLGTPVLWAYSQDVGGRYVGSVLGWGNMWGNLGGAVSPLILGWVASYWSWDAMFLTCAGAFLLAGICSLAVDATRPVVPEVPLPG